MNTGGNTSAAAHDAKPADMVSSPAVTPDTGAFGWNDPIPVGPEESNRTAHEKGTPRKREKSRLLEVIRAKAAGHAVFVVESEKDANALAALGVCCALPTHIKALIGAKVIVLPDKDAPGRRHAALMLRELTGKAESVAVVELPDRDGKPVKDASDWTSAGGTVAELWEIVRTAPTWQPPLEEPAALPLIGDNPDIERALAGALLLDAEKVLPLCATLTLGMFHSDHVAAVLDAARRLDVAGRPVDGLTVAEALAGVPPPPDGWAVFISDAIAECPAAGHAEGYVAEIRAGFRRRRLAVLARQLATATSDETIAAALAAIREAESDVAQVGPELLDGAAWARETVVEPDQIMGGCFDMGTKACLVAPSKARKSFFLLQAAISLAAGRSEFLAWRLPKPRRVMLVNLEITPEHFHRRLVNMMLALGVLPDDIGDRLLVLNGRGHEILLGQIERMVHERAVELLILDPVYKLLPGDESDQTGVKALLKQIDRICTRTGAATFYAHHAGKGEAGDRQTIDRASGSGVLARDYDAQISLVSHVEDGLLVAEQIARSYPPRDPFCITWDMDRGCFVMDAAAPVVRTSMNRNKSGRVGPAVSDDDAVALVTSEPMLADTYRSALRRAGFTERAAREVRVRLVEQGILVEKRTQSYPFRVWIGTPDAIRSMKSTVLTVPTPSCPDSPNRPEPCSDTHALKACVSGQDRRASGRGRHNRKRSA